MCIRDRRQIEEHEIIVAAKDTELAEKDAELAAKDAALAAMEAELAQLRAMLPAGSGVAAIRSPRPHPT